MILSKQDIKCTPFLVEESESSTKYLLVLVYVVLPFSMLAIGNLAFGDHEVKILI